MESSGLESTGWLLNLCLGLLIIRGRNELIVGSYVAKPISFWTRRTRKGKGLAANRKAKEEEEAAGYKCNFHFKTQAGNYYLPPQILTSYVACWHRNLYFNSKNCTCPPCHNVNACNQPTASTFVTLVTTVLEVYHASPVLYIILQPGHDPCQSYLLHWWWHGRPSRPARFF